MKARIPAWLYGKQLRQRQTRLESDLEWLVARVLKPYRQHSHPLRYQTNVPVCGYIADIFIEKLKMVLEADGPTHDSVERQAYDARRNQVMRDSGYIVLRFSYKELDHDDEAVEIELEQEIARCHRAYVAGLSS